MTEIPQHLLRSAESISKEKLQVTADSEGALKGGVDQGMLQPEKYKSVDRRELLVGLIASAIAEDSIELSQIPAQSYNVEQVLDDLEAEATRMSNTHEADLVRSAVQKARLRYRGLDNEDIDHVFNLNHPTATQIPEHLLERSRIAKTKAEPTATYETDIFGTDAILDLETPDVCNLHAVAVRKQAVDRLEARLSGEISLPKSRATVHFADSGKLGLVPLEYYTGSVIVGHNGVNLQTWTEQPRTKSQPRRILPDKKVQTTRADLESSTVFFGVSIDTSHERELFIPVFKSIETATGCQILYPNGEDLNGDVYNRSRTLKRLRALFGAEGSYISDKQQIAEFAELAVEAANDSPDENPYIKLMQSYLYAENEANKTLNDRLEDMLVILRSSPVSTFSYNNEHGQPQEGEAVFKGSRKQVMRGEQETLDCIVTKEASTVDGETGLIVDNWIYREGLQQATYGKIAKLIPRMKLTIDELNNAQAEFYGDNYTTTHPAGANQIRHLLEMVSRQQQPPAFRRR